MEAGMKGARVMRQGIYVDCKWLLRRLYRIRFKVPKRDRGYLFDSLLIPTMLSMIGHFRRAYTFREERLKEMDDFLFDFERFNALVDMASEEKIIDTKEYASLFEYTDRIYEGAKAYRASARKNKTGHASNDGMAAETDDSRGGDGLIQPSSGSAP